MRSVQLSTFWKAITVWFSTKISANGVNWNLLSSKCISKCWLRIRKFQGWMSNVLCSKKKVVFQSDLLLHLEIVMLSFCYGKKHYNEEVFTLCFSFVMVKITTIKKCLPCCCSAKGHTACKAYRWKALVNGDRLIMIVCGPYYLMKDSLALAS